MENKVYLMGAGPGDLGLMTVKGLKAIQSADVLIYDYLANPKLLNEAPAHAKKIYVGKQAGNHAKTQDQINQVLVDEGSIAQTVVRLKGGDPYVFGRGGEEAEVLRENGIAFEIIPGITSAVAGPAYAGIPVTHRGISTSFHVMTGHFKSDDQEWDWEALARLGGTLIFLMGVGNLDKIASNLMKHGLSADKPVALIRWATHAHQQTVTGTLGTIVDVVASAGLKPPALIVIGDVVNKRQVLNFFEEKPLFGKRIGVTRARAQASALAGRLEELGAVVAEVPMIEITAPDDLTDVEDSIQRLHAYNKAIFTSANAVHAYMTQLEQADLDVRSLAGIKIFAMGKGTTDALSQYGLRPDFVPERQTSEGLVDLIEPLIVPTEHVLFPHGEKTRGIIEEALKEKCHLDSMVVYRNRVAEGAPDQLNAVLTDGDLDMVTFTSASTVHNYMQTLDKTGRQWNKETLALSIGPITTHAIKSYEIPLIEEVDKPSVDLMVDHILTRWGKEQA